MTNKRYVLRFPPHLVKNPIASHLVSAYKLVLNILRADIEPDKEGMLVVEISGSAESIKAALAFLKNQGVDVESLSQGITWQRELCIDCTACRTVCPSGALLVRYPEMVVDYDCEKCIACELCLSACPYGAVSAALEPHHTGSSPSRGL